jgi:outer membrane protein
MTQKLLLTTMISTLALCGFASVSHADEYKSWMDKERFQIRGRMVGILAKGEGTVNGTSLKTGVDNSYVPEVDFTYFITRNISAELIAATAKHTVSANTSKVGDTWVLPPTLTLQYHFTPDSQFSPYVGAGLNYSWFYGEDVASGFTKMGVDGGLGYAVQAGFDYWINKNWGFNMDVKYIDLNVDVSVNNGALHANNVELNPFVVGAGVSYRF